MPKIAETTKILFMIYLMLTVCETIALIAAKMPFFDAINTTMSTVATGGFAIKNLSIAAYNSPVIEVIITIFMFLSGINFVLYFRLITKNYKPIFENTELKAYCGIFIVSTLFMTLSLFKNGYYGILDSLRYASFQSAAIMTTTGFATANYCVWPAFAQVIILFLMFSGACSGSTSGNIKIIRHVMVWKNSLIQLKKMIRPRAVYSIKKDGTTVGYELISNIHGFFILYFILLILTTIVVATGGFDIGTCISTAVSTVGNVGPGFWGIGPTDTYNFFQDYIKWFLSFIMLTGRLELYSIMLLFTTAFWRR